MQKLTNYIIIMTGIMLVFYFMGLIQDTGNSALLNLVLNPEGLRSSTMAGKLILVLEGIATIGTILVGAYLGYMELIVVAPMAIYMFNLLWDFIAVFDKVRSANPVFAILIFSPLLILYVVTLVEWWRGRD